MTARSTSSAVLLLLLSACTAGTPDSGQGAPRASSKAALRTASLECSNYAVTDLGTLPGGSVSIPNAIDDAGAVAGTAWVTTTAGPLHAFSSAGDGLVDLGTLGGANSFGYGVHGGKVVGQSDLPDGARHAFLHDGAGIHDLGALDAANNESEARGLNASGIAVGASRAANGFERAVRFEGGAVTDLGTLRGGDDSNASAFAINTDGVVVGSSDTATGPSHAAKWVNGAVSDLGALSTCTSGCSSTAVAVNGAGHAAGSAKATRTSSHPVVFRNGAVIDLGLPAGYQTGGANGFNDAGYVVATATYQQGEIVVRHGFLHDGGGFRDLNDLTSGSGWEITDARGINGAGQIVASGVGSDGRTHALLLTPECTPPVGPDIRSISTVTNNTTVSAPEGVASGDFLLAALEYCADPVAITPPAGWTLVADQISGEGTEQVFHALVYSHLATAREPAEYTFAAPEGVYVDIQVAAYTRTTAVDAVAGASAFGTSIDAPSVTTTGPNGLLVAFYVDFASGVWSIAPGMSERSNFDANSLQDEARPTAGPTGPRTATNSEGALAAISIALK